MNAGALLDGNSALRLRPGRSFAFSPAWRDDGLSVVFDRDSGDYWVVSALARALVETLVRHDGQRVEDIVNAALHAVADEAACTAEHGRQVLTELLRLDLVMVASSDRPRPGVDGSRELA